MTSSLLHWLAHAFMVLLLLGREATRKGVDASLRSAGCLIKGHHWRDLPPRRVAAARCTRCGLTR